ncbi:MAG: hypothetical protein PHP64_05720 [Actinomycetota bacterium]|nr:hypothetical protein [Actinomycetota bacterium]
MRKRQGQADRFLVSKKPGAPSKSEKTESTKERGPEKSHISLVTAITIGTQLALDIIRVVREATDLKRKLFPAKQGIASQASGKESG